METSQLYYFFSTTQGETANLSSPYQARSNNLGANRRFCWLIKEVSSKGHGSDLQT
jgi:hypothetical protein